MTKSLLVVLLGVFISLVIGLLLVFGILFPVFAAFRGGGRFGLEIAGSTALPLILLVFATALAFYFGGMAAGYYASGRRRLHGVLVALVASVISPIANLASGKGPFPNVDTTARVLLLLLFFAVSVAASYVGARRGEGLYVYNSGVARRRRRRQARE